MCGFINDIVDSIVDIVEDVVDIVVDVVEDVIGWLIPMPEIPDFGQDFSDENNRGALVNKFTNLRVFCEFFASFATFLRVFCDFFCKPFFYFF